MPVRRSISHDDDHVPKVMAPPSFDSFPADMENVRMSCSPTRDIGPTSVLGTVIRAQVAPGHPFDANEAWRVGSRVPVGRWQAAPWLRAPGKERPDR